MKRKLLLSTLLLACAINMQAWDIGVNRENKGRRTNWKWRIYTNNWGTTNPWGPSQLLYVYDAGGGRNIGGNVDLAWDLWDTSTHNLDTGQWAYFWRGRPYTVLGAGLFKDTSITGVTNMNFTYSSPMIVGGPSTPIYIQTIGDECFRNSAIQGEVINYTPASVTSVGHHAFAECKRLSGNLLTPENLTYIPEGMYENCKGMTGWLHTRGKVTGIGRYAFQGCSNLSGNLELYEGLKTIEEHAFYNCSKLTGNIYIPNSVNNMGIAVFENCEGFNGTLDYADNMTTVPDYTFHNCKNLRGSIVIPSKVQTIGKYAFQNCYNFNGQLYLQGNVWFIGEHAFESCHRLNGNLDLHTVTRLSQYAFNDCPGVNGRLILSGSLENIPPYCFNNCYRMSGTLNIPRADFIGAHAFQNCSGFTAISLPNTLQYIAEDAFQGCFNMKGDLNIRSSTWIGDRAFRDCRGFNGRLYLPNNLKDIRYAAFWECNNLSGNLVLPSGLEKIGQEAFVNCYNLTGNVTIPAGITTLRYHTFWQCHNLESFTFATGSHLNDLDREIFPHCISLKYVDMTNCPTINIPIISRANSFSPFGQMRPYTIVYLPNGTNASNIPADQENFVVDGKCANFKVYDTHADYKSNRGCDYEIKHQFTAAKANYTRTFSGTDAATLFLPYPTTLPAGMTAYELKLLKRKTGDPYFVFSPLPTSATLQANKPYIVRVTDGGSHTLPEMHNVVVPVTPAISTTGVLGSQDANWMFNGSTQYIPNATAATMKAYNLNVGNTWLPITSANTNGHIHSFRAFLTSPTGNAPAKGFVMVLDDGPVITNIDDIKKGETDVKSGRYPFYSLDGRNLGRNYDTLPAGNIYIVNGKKFYKK